MDGVICNLEAVCDLADKYNALVMVDDSHAVGFVGENGRGTPEYCGVLDRVDIITGTLGKALGGASGGYTSGKKRNRRVATSTLTSLFILKLFSSFNRYRFNQSIRYDERGRRSAC